MGRKDKQQVAKGKDPYVEFAHRLRAAQGIEWRNGIADANRVEYIRGKDFLAYIAAHPEVAEGLPGIEANKPGRTADVLAMEVHYQMAVRRLFMRAERLHKKPKPGRDKLVKWPKKLVYVQNQALDEAAFYCWTFDRPASPWLWVGSAMLAVLVFLMCLFPLAPYSVKISVVYLSMGLLGVIFLLIFVRAIVFAFLWVLLGRNFWLLPNVLSDELGFVDSFKPLYAISVDEEGKEYPTQSLLSRLGVGVAVALACYTLHEHAPDKGSVKTGLGKAHDSILAALSLHDPGKMKISDASGRDSSVDTTGTNATMESLEEPCESDQAKDIPIEIDPLADPDIDPVTGERFTEDFDLEDLSEVDQLEENESELEDSEQHGEL